MIARINGESCNDGVAEQVGVIHIEEAVVCIMGMKGEAEETTLTGGSDSRADVKERLGEHGSVFDDANSSALLDDKQSRVIFRRGYQERSVEAISDKLCGKR